ncbi:MAG: hypothetical protein SPJ12_03405 [Duodenibacillus sp.]|nr:hypothetical protein [Duodenibacillus sp.]
MPSIVTKALTEAAVLFASHTLAPKTFAGFWKSVSPRLAEGVGYIDKHQNEGLEADKTFLEIITFRDAKIERIVNGCLKEFLHSDVLALIESVERIQNGIQSRREQINAWKLATLTAPATSLMPLKVTRAALNRRIEREREAIAADEKRIERLKNDCLERLSQAGIRMTLEQIDGLLYTAEGTELANTMAVAQHIKEIEAQLATLIGTPDAGPEQVKQYTGFLMMSYRVYIAAIERAIEAVQTRYMPRLEDIISQADSQMQAADRIQQSSSKRAEVALNNIELNARTIELAQLYRKHLDWRVMRLKMLKADMKGNFELAHNTFRTVKLGSELIDVIKTGEKDLLAIFEFEPPEIDAFYDKDLRREFDALTEQLRGPAPVKRPRGRPRKNPASAR